MWERNAVGYETRKEKSDLEKEGLKERNDCINVSCVHEYTLVSTKKHEEKKNERCERLM